MSLHHSVLTTQNTRQQIGVAVLKKAQETMKQEGEAMVHCSSRQARKPATDPNSLLDA